MSFPSAKWKSRPEKEFGSQTPFSDVGNRYAERTIKEEYSIYHFQQRASL